MLTRMFLFLRRGKKSTNLSGRRWPLERSKQLIFIHVEILFVFSDALQNFHLFILSTILMQVCKG